MSDEYCVAPDGVEHHVVLNECRTVTFCGQLPYLRYREDLGVVLDKIDLALKLVNNPCCRLRVLEDLC